MAKPDIDLLYVEDIAPFCLVEEPKRDSQEIVINFGELRGRGVDLSDRVVLLSIFKVAKAGVKERLREGNFTLGKYPPYQFATWLQQEFHTADKDPSRYMALNNVYQEASARVEAFGVTMSNRLSFIMSSFIASIMIYATIEGSIPMLEAYRASAEGHRIKGILANVYTTRDFIPKSIDQFVEDMKQRAEGSRNTFGVGVYPIEGGSDYISRIRRTLVEDPLNPGSPAYEDNDENKESDHAKLSRIYQMGRLTQLLVSPVGMGSFDEVISKISDPRLVITDVYARDLFPELDRRFNVRVLNSTVDVQDLPCYKREAERKKERIEKRE